MDETPVGKRIRAARGFGWFDGRSELAAASEVSESMQQRIEREDREFKLKERLAIVDATGVPMWFLEHGFEGWAKGEVSPSKLRQVADVLERSKQLPPTEIEEEVDRILGSAGGDPRQKRHKGSSP